MRRLSKLSLLISFSMLAACPSGTEPDNPELITQSNNGATKGESCELDTDCTEPSAKCRRGNVCTGALDEEAFQQECPPEGAAGCPGLSCLTFKENVQGKKNMCTLKCNDDSDCGPSAVCVDLGVANLCLRICDASTGCLNGFVCVTSPEGLGSACLVEPP